MKQAEVVIIGGGPIGAIAAMVFRQIFSKVVLLEQRNFSQFLKAKRSRTLALNHQSIKILDDFGLLQPLQAKMAPIKDVHISVKGHIGASRIMAQELGLNQLGLVIEQHYLEGILYQQLLERDVDIIDEAKFQSLSMEDCQVHYLKDNRRHSLRFNYCIGCDGQDSKVRQQMGIDAVHRDYHQTAMVSIVDLAIPHQHVAYEHFCEQGAVAMLPMRGHQATCIWTVPSLDAYLIDQMDNHQFAQGMMNQFKRLSVFKPKVLFRTSFALKATLAHTQAVAKGLLLGNAAHSLHPIAAQGLNLSLRDIATIAKRIDKSSASMESLLKSYQQQAHVNQQDMVRYTHLMATKVGTHVFPSWAKSLGLVLTDSLPGIKKKLSLFNLGVSA